MRRRLVVATACAGIVWTWSPRSAITAAEPEARPRAREIGLAPGVFPPGALNAITDVAGVRVGHVTLVEGDRIRTGVTAVLPHGGNVFRDKVAGGVFVGNAFGKLAGATQVHELGTIESPIVLTNTLGRGGRGRRSRGGGALLAGQRRRAQRQRGRGRNERRGPQRHPRPAGAAGGRARRDPRRRRRTRSPKARSGAGTGTRCFGWKGGIGTSSRVLPARYGGYTLGVLVQTNFGGVLTMDGVPVGRALGRYAFGPDLADASAPAASTRAGGSCMIVVATDAPLSPRDLERLAARAVFGLARTGSSYSHGSGDYAIAFSTAAEARTRHGEAAPRPRVLLPSDAVSPLFQAALESTEEAVYNSLLRATSVTSALGSAEALPLGRVIDVMRRYGRPASF